MVICVFACVSFFTVMTGTALGGLKLYAKAKAK